MFASSPVTLGMAIMSWRNLIAFSRLSSTFRRSFWWTFALIGILRNFRQRRPPLVKGGLIAVNARAGPETSADTPADRLRALRRTCDRSSRRCRQRSFSRFRSRPRGAGNALVGKQIDVQLDDLAAIGDVGHID